MANTLTFEEQKAAIAAAFETTWDNFAARHPHQVEEFLRQNEYDTINDWTAEQLDKGPVYDALVAATAKEISFAETMKVVLSMLLQAAQTFMPLLLA
jgi:hypothetical protein